MGIFSKPTSTAATPREAILAELDDLERRRGAEFKRLQDRSAAAIYWVRKAEEALLERRVAAGEVTVDRSVSALFHDAERQRLEAKLIETAHPAIDEFVRDMWRAIDEANKLLMVTQETARDVLTGHKVKISISNVPSIEARCAACRAAIEAAQAMAINEPDQSVVPRKLAALQAALPAILAS